MSAWQFMSEIARTILIMSVTGSVLALFLFALKPLVKNRLPKSVQYYLWGFVLAALLVPFSTFVSVPVSTPLAPVQEIIETNVKSTAQWQEELAQEQYNTPYEELNAAEQVQISFKEIGLTKGEFNNYILISLITLGGTVFLIEIVAYFIFVMRLRRGRLPAKDHEAALLQRLCENRKPPRIYRNPLAPAPMLIGILRPAVYLPDMEYSKVQLRNILLHELTHLRRHDVMVKWFAALAVGLHWFNPIVYFMRREIDRACELACDEAVIKNLDTNGKQEYGDTLIAVAAEKKLPKTIMSTTMCEEKKALKTRLGAIMTHKGYSVGAIAFSCVLAAAVLCGTVVLGAANMDKVTAPVVTLYAGDGSSLLTADADTGIVELPASVEVQAAYRDNTGNSRVRIYCVPIESNAEPRSLGGAFRDTFHADNVKDTTVWPVADDYPDGFDGYIWAVATGPDDIAHTGEFLRVAYHPENQEITSAEEITIYVWKDRNVIHYALFSGYREQRSKEEVCSGETIFQSLNALNTALSDYPFDYLQLHLVQLNLSDFSKDEMTRLAEQIEIPVGNYSSSIGYFGQ